jgi:CheY-like chemotaxis protein
LVEAMGGTIGLHSTPGVGSTFWVRLPLATQPADHDVASQSLAQPARSPTGTVLYIEDNTTNLALMDAMLGHLPGVRLLAALTGAEGLRLAREQQPDLVLLDIQLPGMDGLEVLAHLRADVSTRHIPVVAVSANALQSDIDAALALGFATYLTKPLALDLLLSTVTAALAGTASAAPAEVPKVS